MPQQAAIDPLAQQVVHFVLTTYGPKLVKLVRRNLSMRSLGWVALTGAILVVPFALAAILRYSGERASNRRYDTADYLSDDLA